MTELIANIARALADAPEEVAVSSTENEGGDVIELRVASRDLGKMIGRQGRTARSLRMILAAAAAKQNRRCVLEIIE